MLSDTVYVQKGFSTPPPRTETDEIDGIFICQILLLFAQ